MGDSYNMKNGLNQKYYDAQKNDKKISDDD